jgi:dolichol-phosphate mannosyltransferase
MTHPQCELPSISVVVPLFNEELNIQQLHRRLVASLAPLRMPYELVFVDDGSRDATPRLLSEIQARDPDVTVVGLSRNFGHQPAVSAGLDHALGRAVIVMDGDLQDPPELLPQFVARWQEGFDVVYAVRQNRKEGPLKRLGYFVFYRVMNWISDLDIPLDSGDFCLMDRKVVDTLKHLPERMRFVRGLRTFVGFRQTGIAYDRAAREAGKPKYTLRALVGLSVDGLVSFSSYPLRAVTRLGLVTILVALGLLVWVLLDAGMNRTAPRGWASLVAVVLLMGSMQLLSLGIIGEYIRLIFIESKGRPSYIVGEYRSRPGRTAAHAGLRANGRDGVGVEVPEGSADS